MTPAWPESRALRQLARITQSTVIRTAAGRGDEEGRWVRTVAVMYSLPHIYVSDILTNNSSGDVDNGPRGLCRVLSTWAEEQPDREGLLAWLLHLHAVVVTAVLSAFRHLLPIHQLLHLAGGIQGAWLVPVEGEESVSSEVTGLISQIWYNGTR